MVNKEGKIKFDNWQKLYHSFMGFLLSNGYYGKFSIELINNLNMDTTVFVKNVVESDLCLVEDMIAIAVEFNEENSDFWNDVNYERLRHCKMFQRTKTKQKYFNSIW